MSTPGENVLVLIQDNYVPYKVKVHRGLKLCNQWYDVSIYKLYVI